MTIQELKQQQSEKYTEVLKSNNIFFAFSDKQFEENKTPLKEGEKYARLFGGGFIPSYNVESYKKQSEDLNTWFLNSVKENNLIESHILYELNNHEAFYTYDIEQAFNCLPYSKEEVQKVFNKYVNQLAD
jgi:hypothetical protein